MDSGTRSLNELKNRCYFIPQLMKLNEKNNTTNDTYVEEETVIGTWIDGKPIYRRVIPNLTTSSGIKYTPVGFEFDIIIRIDFISKYTDSSSGTIQMFDKDFNYRENSRYLTYYQNGRIICNSNGSYTNNIGILILEYTKTTNTV